MAKILFNSFIDWLFYNNKFYLVIIICKLYIVIKKKMSLFVYTCMHNHGKLIYINKLLINYE